MMKYFLNKNASVFNMPLVSAGRDFYAAVADREYGCVDAEQSVKSWDSITENELIKYYDFIFFLEGESIIYYLPAYISLMLTSDDVVRSHAPDCFFMTLSKLERSKANQDQIEFLREFLGYCERKEEWQEELDDELLSKAIENLEKIGAVGDS